MRTGKSHAVHVIVWHVTLHSNFLVLGEKREPIAQWGAWATDAAAALQSHARSLSLSLESRIKGSFWKVEKTEIPFYFPVTNFKKADMMKKRSPHLQTNIVTDNKGERIFLVALGFGIIKVSINNSNQSTRNIEN